MVQHSWSIIKSFFIKKFVLKDIQQIEMFDGNLWILTNKMLLVLPIHNCEFSGYCSDCVKKRDPYCAWDESSIPNQCVDITSQNYVNK
jgi:hypothetical protein